MMKPTEYNLSERNNYIYILWSDKGLKKSELAMMFGLTSTRIDQIIKRYIRKYLKSNLFEHLQDLKLTNTLAHNGVKDIEDLNRLNRSQLLKMRNISIISIKKIEKKLGVEILE